MMMMVIMSNIFSSYHHQHQNHIYRLLTIILKKHYSLKAIEKSGHCLLSTMLLIALKKPDSSGTCRNP